MHRVLRLLAPIAAVSFLATALAQSTPSPSSAPPGTSPPPASAPSGASPGPSGASEAPSTGEERAPAIPRFPVEEARLSNGLRVLYAPDTALPDVAVAVKYHVGHGDDPEGLRGIAHLVEHLTYQRTEHVPRGSLLRLLANSGASALNGTTGADRTYYHEVVPPERLELALWAESDRMGFFVGAVDEEALAQERAVVASEMRARVFDRPGGLQPLAALDATFPSWHPYHEDAERWQGDLDKITLADVRAFFATWYGPENATLILAGHFDPDRAKKLVDRYFGTLPGRPPPARPAMPKIERRGTTRIEIGASVQNQELDLTWVTPAYGMPGDSELDWIGVVLSGSYKARLERRLVAGGLALDVSAGQRSRHLASLFQIHVLVATGHTAEEARDAIDEELGALVSAGPTADELSRASAAWEKDDLFSLESSLGRAQAVSSAQNRPRPLLPFDWREHLGASPSAESLRATAEKYLAPSLRAGEAILRPRKGAPLAGVVVKREEP